ncbi:sulfite exporter TauE/SafE family protein [Acidihalobacter prosperus]|uniref:Probable membrane transporter protein n=1 Tax=Acidihalobacter prosperus TaxID=160660 RepID=A0A1A6C486_9GAMM|nr:sulfite exporter TauE/SafE family protein [Acidihalobacter prosperus]OBS09376.1 permease [Acidihalobacter prosperus]
MDIFLPIAHMDVNLLIILFFGAVVGFLSGLVGVGGGFLITPLLLFIGVPPLVAVASGAAQIVGTSASGSYAHWRLGNVDFRMAFVLLIGSWTGGAVGVHIAQVLQAGGDFGTIVTFLYVGLLGIVGSSMLIESLNALRGASKAKARQDEATDSRDRGGWMARLPLQIHFPVSQLRLSLIVPIVIGFGVGILTSLMGVGGGFIMVPVMIYLLRMPTKVVVGTSLFQLLFTTAEVSILQAGVNHAVDPFLALVLVIGSALGTQWGTKLGARLPGEQLRLILALVVVAVAVKMLFGILIKPHDIYSLVLAR